MKRGIIWCIWVLLWLTPVIVAMASDSPAFMLGALTWAVVFYKLSVAFGPAWMKTVLNTIIYTATA